MDVTAPIENEVAAIVILGQSLNADGSSPSTLVARTTTAAERIRQHPAAVVVASGGDPAGTGVPEAE
eukprot:7387816-Prymnesium_polylepis.1